MAGPRPIRVVVGEDQPIFRDGIVHVLQEEGFEIAGTAGDAPELVSKIRACHPDVVVTDIQMPPDMTDDGLRAVLAARREHQRLGVLVLSQFLEDRYALDLVAGGSAGVGYLLKEKVGQIAMFTDAVGRVARGETVLDPEVVSMLVGRRRRAGPLDDLTSREWQVLELIAQGRSNPGIAEDLTVTVGAVEHHVTHIFDKLGLSKKQGYHRRVLAVLEYLKR
ncbi:MAG TPA: response regulator transcription factor [Trebonia sp.]